MSDRSRPWSLVAAFALISGCAMPTPAEPPIDAEVDAARCASGVLKTPEICDGIDNDCDGAIDEDFDLDTDPSHCGGCNRPCGLEDGERCVDGACQAVACPEGSFDLDGDPSNGCEVRCEPDGPEICDRRDNDCDGRVDEDFDLRNDPSHCGACDRICEYAHATASCDGGECLLLQCDPGWGDLDGDDTNGCESSCEPENPGPEICDGEDNDCDGAVDEGFDPMLDPENCGACGHRCAFANGDARCQRGACVLGGCDPGFVDADGDDTNGCETRCTPSQDPVEICDGQDNDCNGVVDDGFDFDADLENCGGCGALDEAHVCRLPNAINRCDAGACVVDGCLPGFADFDGDPANGCETPYECEPSGDEICDGADNNCDGRVDEGFDLNSDPANCGACDRICQAPNAVAGCLRGRCTVAEGGCEPGFVDRDLDPTNGCELECTPTPDPTERCDGVDNDCDGTIDEGFDLFNDVRHCGRCGRACPAPHALPICNLGGCDLGPCDEGWVDADGDTANGCELECTPSPDGIELCDGADNDCDGAIDEDFDLQIDLNNCGGCGVACAVPNAQVVCFEGQCGAAGCRPGWRDINGDLANAGGDGCEYACTPTPNPTERCDGIDNDCDGAIDEDFNLDADPINCGACGISCAFDNAWAECAGGLCAIARCADGFVDANGSSVDGCEYACTPTADPTEICDGVDNDCNGTVDEGFDLRRDLAHCGACGNRCAPENAVGACRAGRCGVERCAAGFLDRDLDPANGCEVACVPTADPAEICDGVDNDCDGVIDEGFNLLGDPDNCGGCGVLCRPARAVAVCNMGVCDIGGCDPGFVDADGDPLNGCELGCVPSNGGVEACDGLDNDCDGLVDEDFDLQRDPAHCGGCGRVCSFPNGQLACEAGQCQVAGCLPDWWDANGDPADGCEYACVQTPDPAEICDGIDNDCNGTVDDGIDLATDLDNCGACGISCRYPNAQSVCAMGGCALVSCDAGFVDVNANPFDGCEYPCTPTADPAEICDGVDNDCNGTVDDGIDLSNDVAHCGACFRACALPGATPFCNGGQCRILSCDPGLVDSDGAPANGCECALSNGGVEICDGADNDCNGVVDDPARVAPPGDFVCLRLGVCQNTRETCANGRWTCPYPRADYQVNERRCDNLDNDCDGTIDEGFPGLGGQCSDGLGACLVQGSIQCNPTRDGTVCDAVADLGRARPEICNGVDDDCDGTVDEGSDAIARVPAGGGVAAFGIYAYEASRTDGDALSQGQSFARACSKPDALPWTRVDFLTAQRACQAAGLTLCSAAQWQRACAGDLDQPFPYGGAYLPNVCNGQDFDTDALLPGNQDAPLPGGTLPACRRSWPGIVADLSGNVWEWTTEDVSAAGDGSARGIRGGSFGNIEGGLTCHFVAAAPSGGFRDNIGFRCCTP